MEFAKLNCPAGNYPRYSPTLLTEISARRIAEMRPDICNGLAGSAPFLFNVECPPFKQVRSRRILRDSSANTPCSFGEYSMLIRRILHAHSANILPRALAQIGKKAAWLYDLSGVSEYKDEAEVLFPPYSEFKVIEEPREEQGVMQAPRRISRRISRRMAWRMARRESSRRISRRISPSGAH